MVPILPDGWFSAGDIQIYRYIYTALIPANGHPVEIGVYRGRSLMSVADLILKRNITVSCIDLFEPYAADPATDRFEQFARTAVQFGVAANLHILKGESRKTAEHIEDG